MIKMPPENISAMVSISETVLVTNWPIGVLSKCFNLKLITCLNVSFLKSLITFCPSKLPNNVKKYCNIDSKTKNPTKNSVI